MSTSRIINLVDEIIESGRSPEAVCTECPELLPQVLSRLEEYRALESELDTLFPGAVQREVDDRDLPRIDGYDIIRTLGSGGMGVVYLARHLALHRHVATKMLLAGRHALPVDRERFLREARALATLKHPGIVTVFDVGESEGHPFFTMEYLDGGTLATHLAGTPQPPIDAARLVLKLADAMETAHQSGIIHRDLKPSNILLDAFGEPRISDFGIARSSTSDQTITRSDARLGTPSYMAPEQASGDTQGIGPATDLYALGAVFYELLTGRPPFKGSTPSETERQILRDEPAAPRILVPSIPRDLETICLKLLQKSPQRRYPSAAELSADISRFLAGKPILARRVGRAERVWKWSLRNPGTVIAGTSCILLLVAAASAVIWRATEHAALFSAVEIDLDEAASHQQAGKWDQSSSALERAAVRLGNDGSSLLHDRRNHLARNLALVEALDATRASQVTSNNGRLKDLQAAEKYLELFKLHGIGTPDEFPETVAARIKSSPIATLIVSSMDHWATCVDDQKLHAWLIATTQLADTADDPGGWRRRARIATPLDSPQTLEQLASDAPVAVQSPSFLYSFSLTLLRAKVDTIPYLTRA